MSARIGFVAFLSLCAATVGSARAGVDGGLRFPFEHRTWTIERPDGTRTELTQTFGGFVGTAAFSPSVSVVLSSQGASSRRETESLRDELGGMSDLRGELYLRGFGDRLLVVLGAAAPTGTTALDAEELRAAEALANPLLGSPLREYGRGFTWNAGLAWAFGLGRGLQLGLGAGVLAPGTFTLIEGTGDFSPTPEASASAGLELRATTAREETRAASLRITGRTYFEDTLDGRSVFEEGDQIEVALDAGADFGSLRAAMAGQVIGKNDNTAITGEGDLVEAVKSRSGRGISAAMELTARVTRGIRVGIGGEWRRFEESDLPEQNGDAFGAGPVVLLAPSRSFLVKLGGSYRTGSAGARDEVDLHGFSLTATLMGRTGR